MSYPVEKKTLHVPPLEDVRTVLEKGLSKNFSEVSCQVVPCPDLTQKPWGLASPGLSGSPRVGEAGGVPNLLPRVNKSKIYDLKDIGKLVELSDAFILGAGAGPFNHVGVNSEFIPNVKVGSEVVNNSRVAKVGTEGECVLNALPQSETTCGLMLNFYACEGKLGNVLKVRAKKRTGTQDFVGCMRSALEEAYGEQVVGIGGTFRVPRGSVKLHVMPEFSLTPICNETEVDDWLNFYETKEAITFMSVALSRDPDMDIRLEHTHGYGKTEGGHYHYDVTPDEVEYEGYFNIAEFVYRLDRPPK